MQIKKEKPVRKSKSLYSTDNKMYAIYVIIILVITVVAVVLLECVFCGKAEVLHSAIRFN